SGSTRTEYSLFVATSSCHLLILSTSSPGLHARLPTRVELPRLGEAEFVRILTERKNALVKQYTALLDTEGVKLTFTEDAVSTLARYAALVNEQTENIGARRLHTILDTVLDEISFEAPELKTQTIKINV